MNTTAAIAGVGYTAFSRDSGRSVLSLATEACRNALDDAGLTSAEVDGVASFMVMHDSVHCQAVATSLAVDCWVWTYVVWASLTPDNALS